MPPSFKIPLDKCMSVDHYRLRYDAHDNLAVGRSAEGPEGNL